jgi:hypothetical protein
VKRSILAHLWYLTEPLVIFGLFDDKLHVDIRTAMARKLRDTPKPESFNMQKPIFPREQVQNQDNNLVMLVGPQSWLIFDLLDMEGGWLGSPAGTWQEDEEYKHMAAIVCHIPVVNDAAERSVKDIQDYASVAKDGKHRENIMLVSNSHRAKIPAFLKNEMEEHL